MASMVTVSQFELKEKRRRIATEIMLFEGNWIAIVLKVETFCKALSLG